MGFHFDTLHDAILAILKSPELGSQASEDAEHFRRITLKPNDLCYFEDVFLDMENAEMDDAKLLVQGECFWFGLLLIK
jgi:hypothetical protein